MIGDPPVKVGPNQLEGGNMVAVSKAMAPIHQCQQMIDNEDERDGTSLLFPTLQRTVRIEVCLLSGWGAD